MFLVDQYRGAGSVLPGVDMKTRALAALRTDPTDGGFLFLGYSTTFSALMYSPLESVVRYIHRKPRS